MTTRPREYLLDVSRLIWRLWRGRPATGIDRVCLAYLERFGPRALLVVQRRGRIFVLSARASAKLRRTLLQPDQSRPALLGSLLPALATARQSAPRKGMIYLNVGHTGLDEPALARWIADNGLRAIYLIHDLIPLTHPQFCRPGERVKHDRRMRNALASGSGIIVNSRVTGDELCRFACTAAQNVPPVLAAWLGVEPLPEPGRLAALKPYFITVGTIEARKNHLLLLDVWERLVESMGDQAPKLIIAGGRGWEAQQAFDRLDRGGSLRGHVRELNDCTDADLAGWIARARALLMPSFVEGYGLPVMEALRLGTPVIASDLAVYREVVGDVPTYVDPNDARNWEAAIRSFLDNSPERSRQLSLIKDYRPPSWAEHFAMVEAWLATIDP